MSERIICLENCRHASKGFTTSLTIFFIVTANASDLKLHLLAEEEPPIEITHMHVMNFQKCFLARHVFAFLCVRFTHQGVLRLSPSRLRTQTRRPPITVYSQKVGETSQLKPSLERDPKDTNKPCFRSTSLGTNAPGPITLCSTDSSNSIKFTVSIR